MIFEKREDLEKAVAKETGFVQVRGSLIHELAKGVKFSDDETGRAIEIAMDQTGSTRRPAHLTIDCCKRLLTGASANNSGGSKTGDGNPGGKTGNDKEKK